MHTQESSLEVEQPLLYCEFHIFDCELTEKWRLRSAKYLAIDRVGLGQIVADLLDDVALPTQVNHHLRTLLVHIHLRRAKTNR